MTTYTVSIDEKSKEGKALIAKLKSSIGVVGVWRTKRTNLYRKLKTKRKVSTSETKEDEALVAIIKKEETGKLVSKRTILKALKAVK